MKISAIILIICLSFRFWAQNAGSSSENLTTYISKKKVYQIQYDAKQWQKDTGFTKWDLRLKDAYGLVSVYFSELNHFVSDNKLKQTIKAQFESMGKIKNLKIYKKKLTHLTVNYFEYDLKYNGYQYKYEGFLYDNGRSGTIELQFGGGEDNIKVLHGLIEEFCNGVMEMK